MPSPEPRLVGAGALIRNQDGDILLVNPTYKEPWEIPGGLVESGESPRQACERELEEELGRRLPLGRLLVVDWLPSSDKRPGDRILFVFDGGVIDERILDGFVLPADELSECRFVTIDDAGRYLGEGMVRRVREALAHAVSGTTGYLEFGWPDALPIVGA
jgi:ADP-ribose pyrophosphatase YjhB (NUDIX family)